MSEFKFACPVCGQHITADSSASGGQLECPTCYQKIVVPQAPNSPDSKFILSASQVGKPRPVSTGPELGLVPENSSRKGVLVTVSLLVLVCAGGAAAFMFRERLFPNQPKKQAHQTKGPTNAQNKSAAPPVPLTVYPVPTNFNWTLDLTNSDIPQTAAAGSLHGHGFLCERAILQAVGARDKAPARCDLTLRQGRSSTADLGVTVQLFAQQGEELSGKSIEISSERPPPVPRVVLRWRDDQGKGATHNVNSGYALKVVFGEAASGRMPGKIYICLPDEYKSFMAGTFEAEIRKPPAPKPPKPKNPKSEPQKGAPSA